MKPMRRTIALIATLSLLVCAATALAAHSHHRRQHPRLTLLDAQPVSVRGHGFQRRERVRVVVSFGEGRRYTRHVRASRRGTFTATFPSGATGGGPCARPWITAYGARGSHAVLKGLMRPMCIAS